MDKLADGLQKLGEDDLLQVVQMVHDNKAPDSYTVNDVERTSLLAQPYHINPPANRYIFNIQQKANSTLIYTPYQTPSSKCSGTLYRHAASSSSRKAQFQS